MNPITEALLWLERNAIASAAFVGGLGIGLFTGFTLGWRMFT